MNTATVSQMWRTFSADDWYHLPGRGWVAICPCGFVWRKTAEADFRPGCEVLIDGRLYTVKGIESFAIDTISPQMGIGILVGEP